MNRISSLILLAAVFALTLSCKQDHPNPTTPERAAQDAVYQDCLKGITPPDPLAPKYDQSLENQQRACYQKAYN